MEPNLLLGSSSHCIGIRVDNQVTGKSPTNPPDFQLFPTEEKIVQNYIEESFASSPLEQKEQLEKGWKRYLIENWSTGKYTKANLQLEEAEFAFTIARLNLLHDQPQSEWLNTFHEKLSFFPFSFIFFGILYLLGLSVVQCNRVILHRLTGNRILHQPCKPEAIYVHKS